MTDDRESLLPVGRVVAAIILAAAVGNIALQFFLPPEDADPWAVALNAGWLLIVGSLTAMRLGHPGRIYGAFLIAALAGLAIAESTLFDPLNDEWELTLIGAFVALPLFFSFLLVAYPVRQALRHLQSINTTSVVWCGALAGGKVLGINIAIMALIAGLGWHYHVIIKGHAPWWSLSFSLMWPLPGILCGWFLGAIFGALLSAAHPLPGRPARPRFRFRFRLRTAMIAVAIVATLLGLGRWWLARDIETRIALTRLSAAGVASRTDGIKTRLGEYSVTGVDLYVDSKSDLAALHNIAMLHCPVRLAFSPDNSDEFVNMLESDSPVRNEAMLKYLTDESLAVFAGAHTVESFSAWGAGIRGYGFRHLADSPVSELTLVHSAIDDAGASDLVALPKLTYLDLSFSAITDDALQYLAGMRELSFLDLKGTHVQGGGLRHLRAARNLGHLNLSRTPFRDEHAPCFAELPKLTALHLHYTNVSDKTLESLAQCSNIESLYLSHTQITDAGLAHLARIKSLLLLNLEGTRVSDAGLRHLQKSSALQVIYLANTNVTWTGARDFTSGEGRSIQLVSGPPDPAVQPTGE